MERELPCRVASVGEGRRWVASTLEGWGVLGASPTRFAHDDAMLAASELVTAAVRECTLPLVLALVVHHDRITIDVIEAGVVAPDPGPHRPWDGGSVRGEALVAAVSRRWGVETSGAGADGTCRRWCEIGVPDDAALEIACTTAAGP